ncbi:MAG: hypothetical protein ABIO40_04995 [Devosia sp.]
MDPRYWTDPVLRTFFIAGLVQAIQWPDVGRADPGNSIGYEILTSLKGRYTRSYVDSYEGEAAAAMPQQ